MWFAVSKKSWKKFKKKVYKVLDEIKLSSSLEFISAYFKEQQVINTRGGG